MNQVKEHLNSKESHREARGTFSGCLLLLAAILLRTILGPKTHRAGQDYFEYQEWRQDLSLMTLAHEKSIKIFIASILVFFGVNTAFSLPGGYLEAFLQDRGNTVNYTIVVPLMIVCLALAKRELRRALGAPISLRVVEPSHMASYRERAQEVVYLRRRLRFLLAVSALSLQSFNIVAIFYDGQVRTIWLEGESGTWLATANWAYYLASNSMLLYLLLEGLVRWLLFSRLLWQLYRKRRFGKPYINPTCLSRASNNRIFSIGRAAYYFGLTGLFIGLNLTVLNWFNLRDSAGIVPAVLFLFQFLLFIPFLLFVLPVIPVRQEHVRYRTELEKELFNELVENLHAQIETARGSRSRMQLAFKHFGQISTLSSAHVIPLDTFKYASLWLTYLVPLLINLLATFLYSRL